MGNTKVEVLGGVSYIVREVERINKFTNERKFFWVADRPVNPADEGLAKVPNPSMKEHDDSVPKLIPYIPTIPDPQVWSLTPEDIKDAELEAKMAADKDKLETQAYERKKLRETWGDFIEEKGITMHDLFPSVFYKGE